MLDKCPICGEKMTYAGPMEIYGPGGQLTALICDTDDFCLHCGYRFDPELEAEALERGEYMYGDPYQLHAALDAGQMRLL